MTRRQRKQARRLWDARVRLAHGEKISRKLKKAILGTMLNKSKIRKRIAKFAELKDAQSEIKTYFCPQCGCEATDCSDNRAEYPQILVYEWCLRCGCFLSMFDNGWFIHCLELPEYDYDLNRYL